jgi:KDO2-lipid IV(A) lauroyltransferase
VRGLWVLTRCVPGDVVEAIARVIGWGYPRVVRREWRKAIASLATALPERSDAERVTLAGACFRHWLLMLAETATAGRPTRARTAPWILHVDGMHHLDDAVGAGRGAVLALPHFGNWELAGAWMARRYDFAVIAKRVRNARFQALVARIRSDFGVTMIYQDEPPIRAVRHLKRGGVLATLPDQDLPRLDGVHVPFFGRPALTPTGPATLAMAAGAPLLPVRLRRIDGHLWRYDGTVAPPVALPDRGTSLSRDARRDAIVKATAAVAAQFEAWIREDPEQWAWMHERWKTPPEPHHG